MAGEAQGPFRTECLQSVRRKPSGGGTSLLTQPSAPALHLEVKPSMPQTDRDFLLDHFHWENCRSKGEKLGRAGHVRGRGPPRRPGQGVEHMPGTLFTPPGLLCIKCLTFLSQMQQDLLLLHLGIRTFKNCLC